MFLVAPVNFHHSLEILKDWINLIDDDGWVAREQILGEEARSKARHQIRPQHGRLIEYLHH
jgi:hypothetical protein